MSGSLDLKIINELTAGKFGVHAVPCPLCSPTRKPANRRKPVLKIWYLDAAFATFNCAHCLEHGFVRDGSAPRLDPVALERAKRETAEWHRIAVATQLRKARWLWSKRRPLAGSIGEAYLREARGYNGPMPATLGFLPADDKYPPALIAALGLPEEPEPDLLTIANDAVRAVHLVRLAADGLARLDKTTIGPMKGFPIVVAPANDLLAIGITEGLEDALSVHEMTGLGAWAGGGASHLSALADAVPTYIECVSVFEDDDDDGRRYSAKLAARLGARGFEAVVVKARRL